MSVDRDLSDLADLCGILPDFYDLQGNQTVTSPDTQKALLSAYGMDVSSEAAIHSSLADLRHQMDDRWFPEEIIVQSGCPSQQQFGLGANWELRLDESTKVVAEGTPSDSITLPPLPSGVYALTATASGRTEVVTVLVAPERLPSIQDLSSAHKLWGLNLALYGLQSERNAGVGDYADLAAVAEVAAHKGAGFLGINPVHAMGHSDLEATSPYSPTHRGFLNTTCIALDQIPGLNDVSDLGDFDKIRESNTVDYLGHKRLHNRMLETLFEGFGDKAPQTVVAEFEKFKTERGANLHDFATFEALCEIHGSDWRVWPTDYVAPPSARIDFHMWLQWVATTQLAFAQTNAQASGMPLGLYLDLAVGARRDGGESWCEQSVVAQGISIGAPPDHLNPAGQNWDLTGFSPRKLKQQRYRPLRRILAAMMRHACLIRIDHVLGLNRSFWLPDDGCPGAYIQQPFDSLLAVIKIEAERHNCAVVGEDLGLVPDGFRDTMRHHGFYGYSVLQFEKDDQGAFPNPEDAPAQVLSCFATHDTATVKGYEVGRDIDWWQKVDWIDAPTADNLRQQRTQEVSAFSEDRDFQTSIHGLLAASNASLVAIQLDDILENLESQNLPGTIDEHPNWRRKYDLTLDALGQDAGLKSTAAMMAEANRSHTEIG